MNISKFTWVALASTIIVSTAANAVLGPIPIYLNTEYRTESPIIGSIASSIKLDKVAIQQKGVSTFTELLAAIPGVSFEGGQGNLRALRIRGNEASHTLLLVDGNRVTITGGQPNLDVVPLDQIERIEITKGPFSSLYGPGAIGGVIHVFTNKKTKHGKHNTIKISYGTRNSKKVSLASRFQSEDGYLNLTISDYHTDGIDATSDGDLDPIERKSASFNIGTKLSDQTSLKLSLLKTEAQIEYDSAWDEPKPDNNLTQTNIEINHQFNEKLSTKFNYMVQNTKRRGDKYKLNTITVINELDLEKGKLSIGMSKVVDKDIGNAVEIKHTDIFTQWQGKINGNEVSIGGRIVEHEKFSTHTTYNLNWAKNLENGARVTASYGKATNLPDHYKNNLNITHNKTDLKPEHSKNFEIGVSNNYGWGSVNAKAYKSVVSDVFKYVDPDNNWLTDDAYYTNDGVVNIKGIELNIARQLSGWTMNATYDYNTVISESTDLQKGRRPNHSVGITASKQKGRFKHQINLTAKSWAWDRDTHTNNDKLAGYGLINLSTSYDYNLDTKITLNVNNALDKQYTMAKGYNTLGRTITLGVIYSF